jgi:Aminotransferase class-III
VTLARSHAGEPRHIGAPLPVRRSDLPISPGYIRQAAPRARPVPLWRFTLSATQANTEAIRLARAVTGREVVLLFQGHYHGHFEEGMVDLEGERVAALERGLAKGVTGRVRIAQFNDVDVLGAALEPGDVAIVLAEPAMTNRLHLLAPEPGWHEALRRLTSAHGTLLSLDETHTHVVGPGGATGRWRLEPDVITIGKAVAGGVPMGAYGPGNRGGGRRRPRRRRRTPPLRPGRSARSCPASSSRLARSAKFWLHDYWPSAKNRYSAV